MEPPLQALRIPAGWKVGPYNRLYELELPVSGEDANRLRKFFTEDLLQLRHEDRNRLLDAGWYPDEDIQNGSYIIHVHEGSFWGQELHTYSTRDRLALVAEIERLLFEIAHGAL